MNDIVFSILMFLFGIFTASGTIFLVFYYNQWEFLRKGGDYTWVKVFFVVAYLVSSLLQMATMLCVTFANL